MLKNQNQGQKSCSHQVTATAEELGQFLRGGTSAWMSPTLLQLEARPSESCWQMGPLKLPDCLGQPGKLWCETKIVVLGHKLLCCRTSIRTLRRVDWDRLRWPAFIPTRSLIICPEVR